MGTSSRRFRATLLACAVTVAIVGIEGPAGAVFPRAPAPPAPAVAVPFGNNVAQVTWLKPSNGGSRILGYTVWPYNGKLALPPFQYDASKTTRIVTGLKNGSRYHFVVEARNALGSSHPAVTIPMVVGAPFRPNAPTAAQSAPNQLQVVFKAPNNGGAPITSYTVTCFVDIFKQWIVTGPPVPFKGRFVIYVNGLPSGRSYQCRVKATNSRGTGPISTKSPETAVS